MHWAQQKQNLTEPHLTKQYKLLFRPCDESNLGVSALCNLEGQTLTEPFIWGKQVGNLL
jgi:hypothetical protein